jgi:cytochrome c-type biogenesis protein CcmH
MTQFWIAALALGLVAAAMVLVPVIRASSREGEGRSSAALGTGVLVALAVPVVGIIMYSQWSTWNWGENPRPAQAGDEMHEMNQALRALEARLVQNPDELDSWLLLGRTYMSLRRFDDAADAFRRAANLDGYKSSDILSDLGEALALSQPEGLQGEAGAIFERVLEVETAFPKALWYGGLNAYENANWSLAIERFEKLLTLNPPETLVPLIEERIAAAQAHGTEGGAMAGMAAPAPAAEVAAPVAERPAPPPGEGIRLEVSIDPELVARIPRPAPVFIIARLPTGGPPLAVVRARSNELPVSVTLTDANAMMEGVTILDQPELDLVARVSLSGGPAEAPGDLYGAVKYTGGDGGPVDLRIERIAD